MCLSPQDKEELRQLLLIAGVASAKRKEAASCTGKDVFATFDHAQKAIRRHPPGIKLHPYQCKSCQKWHIGRSRERVDRIIYQQRRNK